MTKLLLFAICCVAGLSVNGQITWEVETKEAVNDVGPILKYFLTGVSYASSKTEWTIQAPKVYTKKPFYTGRKKIYINRSETLPVFLADHPFSSGSIVALPFTAGLMILDAKTGTQIKWLENEMDGDKIHPSMRDAYWFDDGKYKITCGKETIESNLVYNASFLKEFKQYLLYFNHHQLFILNKKNGKLIDKVDLEKRWEKKARVYASTRWKKLTVNWDGIIYR